MQETIVSNLIIATVGISRVFKGGIMALTIEETASLIMQRFGKLIVATSTEFKIGDFCNRIISSRLNQVISQPMIIVRVATREEYKAQIAFLCDSYLMSNTGVKEKYHYFYEVTTD